VSPSLQVHVRPAESADVEATARLHQLVLGYTLNAELGQGHLRRLYRALLRSQRGIVLIASVDDGASQRSGNLASTQRIIGFVSGTDDAQRLQADLIQTPGTRILLSLMLGLATHPWLVGKLMTQVLINRPVVHRGNVVQASLLTMGVQPDFGRRGIGAQLVQALGTEFRRRGVKYFHLNTKNKNEHARAFYEHLGGQRLRTWRGNDIYLFEL